MTRALIPLLGLLLAQPAMAATDTANQEQTQQPQLTDQQQKQILDLMVKVDGGRFTMGSELEQAREMEKPAHTVEVSDFYLSKYEVTQALYTLVMGHPRSYFQCEQCPVDTASWLDAQAFIKRLNKLTGKAFRLPTEAEWEYAVRGGQQATDTLYAGSNDIDTVAWYSGNAGYKTHPVGTKAPNELGLYDMTGNVWEWCQDTMDRFFYQDSPAKDPISARSSDRSITMQVTRGGGYEFDPHESTVFRRDGGTKGARVTGIGFRLALSSLDDAPAEAEAEAEAADTAAEK